MIRNYHTRYRIDTGELIFPPLIFKGQNHNCWQGVWTPLGPWVELPEVESADAQWNFDANGVGTSNNTVVMDNIAFEEQAGVGGLYHVIARGYFAPERGKSVTGRPRLWAANTWKNALNGGYQIETWEGYDIEENISLLDEPDPVTHTCYVSGAIQRTWTGIVEDCELDSHPDKITLTARDFGVLFTDQRVMGGTKDVAIQSPITFADRKRTQGEGKVNAPLFASSGRPQAGGAWTSAPQDSPDDVAWVEIGLPAGYYEDFFVAPEWDDMDCYVSVWANGGHCLIDRITPLADGWVDLGHGATPDGKPWLRWLQGLPAYPAQRWQLLHGLTLGDGSKIRFTFTKLASGANPTPGGGGNTQAVKFYAGTRSVCAYVFGQVAKNFPGSGGDPQYAKHWILVEDAADVVRMLCIWAGFQEWLVYTFGWSLLYPLRYNTDKFFADIINETLQQGDFSFYLAPPSNDDRSLGVPVFMPAANLTSLYLGTGYGRWAQQRMLELRDTDMTEAIQVKWDLSNLPFVIRFRGAIDSKGVTLFQDTSKRHMATYWPPWSPIDYVPISLNVTNRPPGQIIEPAAAHVDRVAGVMRMFSQTEGDTTRLGLTSNVECLFGCVLAAMQYAKGMCVVQIQIPGLPGLELNQMLSAIEEATGFNSRVAILSIDSKHTLGPQGSWHMTITGIVLDTEDMATLVKDYTNAWLMARGEKAADSGGAPVGVQL